MQGADRRIAGLWLGLLAFLVYGSWAPMALQPQPLAEAWGRFLALPGAWEGAFSRSDLAVNFVLTVPLAFGAAYLAATLPSPRARGCWTLLAWPALLLVSVGVEFGQLYFPPRTPSWTDVAMQALGSAVGLLLFVALGARAQAGVADLSARLPVGQRLERWLFVYLLLLLAWQTMPLDLTVSPVEIYRKWRDGRVLLLPFSALPADGWAALWQCAADLLPWIPVGALGWMALPRPGLGGLLGRAVAVAAAVELVQLFVVSRVSDVTDVFMGSAGVLAGAALAPVAGAAATQPAARGAGGLAADGGSGAVAAFRLRAFAGQRRRGVGGGLALALRHQLRAPRVRARGRGPAQARRVRARGAAAGAAGAR